MYVPVPAPRFRSIHANILIFLTQRLQLFQALSSLSNRLLNSFFDLFQSTPDLASHEVVDLLSLIHQNVVFQEDARDLEVTLAELRQGMVESVEVAYGLKLASLRNETSREETIHILLDMLEWITQRTKNYHRQFPEPYLGFVIPLSHYGRPSGTDQKNA